MVGEFDLIAALRATLPVDGERVVLGSGDDAAVIRAGGDRSVVSIDTTVDGVHARLDLGDPAQAARAFGWRALTTALSDLAAMGVSGGEAYVALGAPPDRAAVLVPLIGEGLGAAAREAGVVIAGGDLTGSPVTFAAVTVVGWLEAGQQPLVRSGARPGDLLGLTGPIGGAGGGLRLVLRGGAAEGDADRGDRAGGDADRDEGQLGGDGGGDGDGSPAASLRARHLRPVARLAAGVALREAGASAAIDLSDGLLADAGHVAHASGVELAFDAAAVPLADGLGELLGAGIDAAGQRRSDQVNVLAFAQSAGEDFELLVAVPPARRGAAEAAGVTAWVGEVRAGAPAVTGLPASGRGGHDHFE